MLSGAPIIQNDHHLSEVAELNQCISPKMSSHRSLIHSPGINQKDSLSTYPGAVVWQFNSSWRHSFPPTLTRGGVPVGVLPPVTHVLGLAKLLLVTHTLTGLVVEPAWLKAGQG